MNGLQLTIINPKSDGFIKSIDFNHEELKGQLELHLKKYQGVSYSENQIKEAKTERAALNKFKDAIENERKRIKKLCLEPYEAFERKIKELVGLIDAPILAIDTQVKSFEEKQKNEKAEKIEAFYNEYCASVKAIVPFANLFDPKWLNATVKLEAATQQLLEKTERIKNDLKVIDGLKSEHETQLKDIYLKRFDLTAVMQEKTRLEALKAKIEAEKAKEPTPSPAEQPAPTPTIRKAPEEAKTPEASRIFETCFRVFTTEGQLAALGEFLNRNQIKFERI